MDRQHLGQALRQYRIRARINQADMAEVLGVSQGQISRWESGRDSPRAHNADAIGALLWGRADPQRAALAHFVRNASGLLALFDQAHAIVAASTPFLRPDGPLERFGWALDPDRNPAFGPAFRQYRALLNKPRGVIGLRLTVPFEQEGRAWRAMALKTIYPLDAGAVCVAEFRFEPDIANGKSSPTLERILPRRNDETAGRLPPTRVGMSPRGMRPRGA